MARKRAATTNVLKHENGCFIQKTVEYDSDAESSPKDEETDEIEASCVPVDAEEIKETKRCSSNCWGCLNNFNQNSRNKETLKLWEFYVEQRRVKSLDELSVLISHAYQRGIYKNELERNNFNVILWTPSQVYTHLKYKIVDVESEYIQTIIELKQNEDVILDLVYYKNKKTGRIDNLNEKRLDKWMALKKMRLETVAKLHNLKH